MSSPNIFNTGRSRCLWLWTHRHLLFLSVPPNPCHFGGSPALPESGPGEKPIPGQRTLAIATPGITKIWGHKARIPSSCLAFIPAEDKGGILTAKAECIDLPQLYWKNQGFIYHDPKIYFSINDPCARRLRDNTLMHGLDGSNGRHHAGCTHTVTDMSFYRCHDDR